MNTNNSQPTHHATERVLNILEAIAEQPSTLTMSDLSKQLGIPKGTIFPILKTLSERSFIVLNASMRYEIGINAYIIGNSFLTRFHFLDAAEKSLASLTEACQETSHLAVLVGGNVLYLKKVNSPQPIRMVSTVGNQLPAYGTALGKSLLINYSKSSLQSLYPDGLKPLTPHTLSTVDELYDQLVKARKTGFTEEIEESNEGIRCIAVPIYKKDTVIAAVSVATPIFRFNKGKELVIKNSLKKSQNYLQKLIEITDTHIEDLML